MTVIPGCGRKATLLRPHIHRVVAIASKKMEPDQSFEDAQGQILLAALVVY
jgi:hypothetical protein